MEYKKKLLAEINHELPTGVDWHAGARRYVSACFSRDGRAGVERYAMNKPFAILGDQPHVHAEFVAYSNNFINFVDKIRPRAGMKILDVACGAGWFSHYMTKLGCQTFGIDIAEEFITLARRRLREDLYLGLSSKEIDDLFLVHDIEAQPLPSEYLGSFDIAILESCLHHFLDPVAAMSHIAAALKDDGIVVIIEGENRTGPIKAEWMAVMKEFDTLERPYPRNQLEAILDMAGLHAREYVGQFNGWFSPEEEAAKMAYQTIRHTADTMNHCICAKTPDSLNRIFPGLRKGNAIQYGSGWYQLENGFRWCGPAGEIRVLKPNDKLKLNLHGHGQTQNVAVYGDGGLVGVAEFRASSQVATINLGRVAAGDAFSFCSDKAFRPSWKGSADRRLLSFYAETTE